jgi:lactoylglutathione lyase
MKIHRLKAAYHWVGGYLFEMSLHPLRYAAVATLAVLCIGVATASAPGTAPTAVEPAAAMTLDHVALHVANVGASVRFYTETLGLREIPAEFLERRWIGIGARGAIHLTGGRTAPVAEDDAVHFAIAVASLDPVMSRLKSRGVIWFGSDDKPYGISSQRRDGVRQIYFKDPDGYWIEVNDALLKRR